MIANQKLQGTMINDIKPLVEIQDYSLIYLIALLLLALFLLGVAVYKTISLIRSKKLSDKKASYLALQQVDLSSPKEAAYSITKNARVLAVDERMCHICNELEKDLAQYKYKKEVPPISRQTQERFSLFMEIAREHV